jgi:hypothetical protein
LVACGAACGEHHAIGQEGRGVRVTPEVEITGSGPSASYRIVEFRADKAVEVRVIVVAGGDEDLAVEQQAGGVKSAPRGEASGSGPFAGRWIIKFCTCQNAGGGNVGGIRYEIEDGVNGFLVSSIEEAAERIVRLLKDEKLCDEMGCKARETVRQKFLITRYLEQYLDLFGASDENFGLRG